VDVEVWLEGLGLEQYAEAFAQNDVDGDTLLKLTSEDLTDIGVKSVGKRSQPLPLSPKQVWRRNADR
jgi:hypothetical protein